MKFQNFKYFDKFKINPQMPFKILKSQINPKLTKNSQNY